MPFYNPANLSLLKATRGSEVRRGTELERSFIKGGARELVCKRWRKEKLLQEYTERRNEVIFEGCKALGFGSNGASA